MKLDVLCYTHPDETLSGVVYDELVEEDDDRIRPYIVHPEATCLGGVGKRFLGTSQIMRHYPGNPDGDPEDRAAYNTMEWLGADVGSDEVAVYDVHNTFVRGQDHFSVGKRALAATVVGAWNLGFTRCQLLDNSYVRFMAEVPNGATLEFSTQRDRSDERSISDRLCKGLRKLATARSVDLQADIEKVLSRLDFVSSLDIMSHDTNGELAAYVPYLESLVANGPSQKIDLPLELREALNLPAEADLYTGPWGHDNMSPLAPHLGNSIGESPMPRRACFGNIIYKIDPPKIDGNWVLFG